MGSTTPPGFRPLPLILALVIRALCVPPALFAAGPETPAASGAIEIEITVTDADLGIPLEGARIISWDGSEAVCGSGGAARISVPGNRTVTVRVSYPGYEPGRVQVRPGVLSYTAALRLGGALEERELVIEAKRPGSSETVIGRSVAISGRELARSAETGFIEDVMSAVKLLPGVGYVGSYLAMPSIRGGEPGDLTAVYDGFYVERPYHWGGAFSIFDPKMVESAQLSHGVFSARYGHTISGLLDIRSRESHGPGIDLALSTSATNLSLSLPLGDKAGAALMGKVTYWDPFVWAAKQLSTVVDNETLDMINFVSVPPYIRSGALSASWRPTTDLGLSLNGYFGGDGVGVRYDMSDDESANRGEFFWANKIGFVSAGFNWSPAAHTVLSGRLGAGLLQSDLDMDRYSENYAAGSIWEGNGYLFDRTVNVQGRLDLDRSLGWGFTLSAGLEERYSRWDRTQRFFWTRTTGNPISSDNKVLNHGLASALYTVLEYRPEGSRFGAELGLRGDHYLLTGEGFTLVGIPLANPRLNLDYTLAEDRGPLDRASLTLGTGLFSSFNSDLQNINATHGLDGFRNIQNRAWTTVGGTKLDFPGYAFTLEAYFKYVFNRSYVRREEVPVGPNLAEVERGYFFDGRGIIWGFDMMLQKFTARYWDGWISYSYINARYRDPHTAAVNRNGGDWYYPAFHRFHTLNVILNYKPVPAVQLTGRFSLASGYPIPETTAINHVPGPPPSYERIQRYSDDSRGGLVMPLDIKLSIFRVNKKGKTLREIYLNFENLLSVVYHPDGPKSFDANTGKETPSEIASYDLPIPLITFGLKWSY
ncbi:MAG: TonB-dependent receptor plug domain-containing protein [Treponema sp.]|jgi:hypothetical protein|nr:TonB-dependent receptor plug domain-containing protein [Treponema sp.]